MDQRVAVDTNIIVRLLTKDNSEQAEKARALFAAKAVYVPQTVRQSNNEYARTEL